MKKIVIATVMTAGALSLMAASGASLTAKCKGCHGVDFGKKALGVSKVVKNLKAEEIETALKGYKAGTFGGPMKGVMKGQVAGMSDADIATVAKYIAGGMK